MDLELARFQKAQNQERMKEEEEMRCQEDEKRIKAAKFKAALL